MDPQRNAGAEAQAMTTQAKTAAASAVRPEWANARRIVVKIGSALLTDRATGTLKADWLASLLDDVAALAGRGKQVVLVSSGAIALGRHTLKLPKGPLESWSRARRRPRWGRSAWRMPTRTWPAHDGLVAAQILLTLGDTEERRRYLNARHTIETLLHLKALPVVNETNGVRRRRSATATNRPLSARVASMVSADCLVLSRHQRALHGAAEHRCQHSTPSRRHRHHAEVEAMAGDCRHRAVKGGMRTKVEAAKIALGGGTHMVIASGKVLNPEVDWRRRTVHLVPRPLRSDDGAQTLDLRATGAEGPCLYRCRRRDEPGRPAEACCRRA